MTVLPAGTKWGFVPGSEQAGQALYGPAYKGVYAAMAPEDNWGNALKANQIKMMQQDQDMKNRKFNLFQDLFRKQNTNTIYGPGNSMGGRIRVSGPNYINAGPVWTQGQIDAQANLQRGNLLQQAFNETQNFERDAASRGFSPMSPFAGAMGQMARMAANAAAASNETNLNFGAAKANSDARLQAAGINAGMYGDYVRAKASADQYNLDSLLRQQAMQQNSQQDMFRTLLSVLG